VTDACAAIVLVAHAAGDREVLAQLQPVLGDDLSHRSRHQLPMNPHEP
jgi:hypothetical protein